MPKIDLSILNQKQTPAFYASSLATRPAFGFPGRIFIDTDSPSSGLYRDTGAAWVQIADPGAGTTGTLQQVTTNGNTTTQGIIVNAGTFSTVSDLTYNTGNGVDWLIKNIPNGPIVRLKAHGTQSGYANRRGALGWKDNNGVDADVLAWDNTSLTFYTPTYYPVTQGSVLFAGASGLLNQDNANFFWDDTNNRLGINTNTPGASIDVHSAVSSIAQFNQTTATNNSLLVLQNSGIALWRLGNYYNTGANDFGIFDVVGAIQPLTIKKTSGQVLIGTSTVGSGKLVVASASSDNGIQIVGASAPSLRIDSAESGPTKRAGLGISTATNNFIQGSADRDFCIFNGSTAAASPILFGVYDAGAGNVQEAARISAARNFLIGTTTDNGAKFQCNGSGTFGGGGASAYTLDVTGSGRVTTSLNVGAASTTLTTLTVNGDASVGGQKAFWLRDDDGFSGSAARRAWAITANYAQFGMFSIYGGSSAGTNPLSGTAFLNIASTGNLLIGTTTDSGQKLQVNGSASINGLITQGGGIYGATGQFVLGGGATGSFYTFSNSATNQVYLITVRQSGAAVNSVIGMCSVYAGTAVCYNIAQDNTNPVILLTLTASGLSLQLTTGAGYGTTTWEYTITIIKK